MYDELVKRLWECASGECFNCSQYTPTTNASVCQKELMKQAADAIEEIATNYDAATDIMMHQTDYIEELEAKLPRWIPVTERLPENGVHVLLACKTWGGNKYVCDGFHTEKFSQPTEFYEDIDADYSEETDEYYFPEGWWEVIKNWDDYSCVAIEDTVTHWMPLPQPPKEE